MGRVGALFLAWLLVLVTGCSEPEFPRDPEDTLLRATGGELVVGVSPNEPHTVASDDGSVSGDEVEILEAYAASIDSGIRWVVGAESALMEELKLGRLDVVIGGLASDSPWSTHAALTRPYAETTGPDGKSVKLVIATRLGENALLVNLEKFLIAEGLQP